MPEVFAMVEAWASVSAAPGVGSWLAPVVVLIVAERGRCGRRRRGAAGLRAAVKRLRI